MKDDFNARSGQSSGSKQKPPKGKNLPEVVNDVVWARQLHNKVGTGSAISRTVDSYIGLK